MTTVNEIITMMSMLCFDSFFIGLALFAVCIVLFNKFQLKFMNIEASSNDKSNVHCSDKNCARCNKYGEVLQEARAKLTEYKTFDCYEDVKDSLNVSVKSTCSSNEQNPNIVLCKQLRAEPVWDKTMFIDTKVLQSSCTNFLEEFNLLKQDETFDGWKRNTTTTGSWDVFPLINQGMEIVENCKKCPNTMSIIRNLSSVMSRNIFGNVMFSVVYPSTVIKEHYGPCNIRLRCHLGLITPPECVLTVAGQHLRWSQGECVVFDDSFLHSVTYKDIPGAQNDKTKTVKQSEDGSCPASYRAVLIVDLWHPDLSEQERDVFNDIFSP